MSSAAANDEVPTRYMSAALFQKIVAAKIPLHSQPYAVNIGCGDGKSFYDPVYPLYEELGFAGLAVDGRDLPRLKDNLGGFPVVLLPKTWITPDNIASILRDGGCPPNPEYLKMDIDGIDGPVLRAIMDAGFRPLVIQVEINSDVPPPFAFSVSYHPKYIPTSKTGFFGCSLSYAMDLLRPHGYVLVELDLHTPMTHDALFVHRSLLSWPIDLKELDHRVAWLQGKPNLPHLNNVEWIDRKRWRIRTDTDVVYREIWSAMMEANIAKHGNHDVPFELYVSR